MLNRMLDGMPTRPVVYIAPLVVISILIYYFIDLKQRCMYQADLRNHVQHIVQNSQQDTLLRLAEVTPFVWEKVKIFNNFKPERKSKSCPFGWDWSSVERESIISSGQLTVLIFVNKGKLSNYIELKSDHVRFNAIDESLSPDSAIFVVNKSSHANGAPTLLLVQ